MIRYFFVLFTVAVVGCGTAESPREPAPKATGEDAGGAPSALEGDAGALSGGPPGAASGPLGPPLPSGTYAATYEVPVPVDLSAAATYEVPEVNWSIDSNGSVQLEYELPMGLVGTSIQVMLEGRFDAATHTAALSGEAGTADCTISTSAVACSEKLLELAPIETDLTVVRELAASEFAGPAQQRLDVTARFSADPIGIVHIRLPNSGGGTRN